MSKEASSPVADSSTEHETIKDNKDSARMPGGSIELLYCEKCGGLILGGAKNAQPAPNGAGHYCKKCAAATGKAGNDTAPVLPAASAGETKELPKRRPSSVSMPAAKRESTANARSKVLEPQGRSKRQAAPGKAGEADSSKMMIGAGVGVAVLLLLGVLMLGGSSKSGDAAKTASASKSESERGAAKEPERRPTPAENSPAKIVLPAAPAETKAPEPAPVLAQTKSQDEAAKLQKDAAADKPAEPPASAGKADENKTPAPEADKKAETAAKDQAAIEDKKKKDEEEDIAKQPAKTETKAPSNPFSVGDGGAEDPTKVMPGQKAPAQPATPPPAPAAKPKPAFERGKQCALFPADRESKTVDHQSPAMAQGQKSGINETKYDGWSFMGQKLDCWNVKGGVLSLNGQCALTLDGFPSKEFDLKMEVELGARSAIAVMLGSANEGISLMTVAPNAVLPGVWDQTKTQNNVQIDNKAGKPTGVKDNWIPIRITVAQGMVEVFAGNKSVYKERMVNATKFPQFGFLMLGINNNATPTAKVRNATLFAP